MAGVREYFSKHAWQNTELSDLMAELEKASGRDLDQWGRLWLETAGVNTLRRSCPWTRTARSPPSRSCSPPRRTSPPSARTASRSASTTSPRPGKLERVHREELDVDGERTEVPALAGLAQPDLILLNDDDLAYAKVRLDPKSLATATAHLKDFSQSLPRTLVWGSAWDAARDGETPARGYVELILANIAEESDSSVILVQLRQLATTLNFYVAEEHKEATAVSAADRLWELASERAGRLGRAAAVREVLRPAGPQRRTAGHRCRAAGRFPHPRRPRRGPGPALGAARLPRGGRPAGQEQIDAELARDNTATGQNAAALATAAIPTAEAKAAAWDSIVVKGDALQRPAGLRRERLHPGAGHGPAGALRGEVLRRRPGHRQGPHPRPGPADRRRALPGTADHPGHSGPDG